MLTFLFADLARFTAFTETLGDDDATDVAARFYDLAHGSLTGETRLVKRMRSGDYFCCSFACAQKFAQAPEIYVKN